MNNGASCVAGESAHWRKVELFEKQHDSMVMHIALCFSHTGFALIAKIAAFGKGSTSFYIKRGAVARGDLFLHTLHSSCKHLRNIGFYAVIVFIEDINQVFGLVGTLARGVVHLSMSFLVASTR